AKVAQLPGWMRATSCHALCSSSEPLSVIQRYTLCHEGGRDVPKIPDSTNPCNSNELWEKDLKCICQIGLTHYRLSLPWPRLLPAGTTHVKKKIVIHDLLASDVLPMDQGDWKSPEMAAVFDSYAASAFETVDQVERVILVLASTGQKNWAELLDPASSDDTAATERYHAFSLGWFAWPVFVTRDYHEVIRSSIETDQEAEGVVDPSWLVCGVSWLAVVPEDLRKLLNYQFSQDTFNNPAVYITENGFSQVGPVDMEDIQHCGFYQNIIQGVARALREDGVDVLGYFTWSFLDNFEWADGFASACSTWTSLDQSDHGPPTTLEGGTPGSSPSTDLRPGQITKQPMGTEQISQVSQ
uniref:Glucosidase, beta, acid 3 (gene/pseudogene) n=1 Tax=Hucho hucho TaxID=62062 RepID=A0A4W5R2U2_9TELE